MKTRSERGAKAQSKKRKINPNVIIVACADFMKGQERSLTTINQKDLNIIGKKFKVKSENIGKIVKSFQPSVRIRKM